MTGVGAFAGSFMEEPREGQPNSAFLYGLGVAEGIAAGAMLVMIANVMYVSNRTQRTTICVHTT